jgi:hypothetical protein
MSTRKNSYAVRVGVSKRAGARSLFEGRRPFSEEDTPGFE